MIIEALYEVEVAMSEGADDYRSLGGWSDEFTPHRLEGSALAPKPIYVGTRDSVSGGNETVTLGGTAQSLEPPGRRDLWAWFWVMKPGWVIRSWEQAMDIFLYRAA